MAKKKKQGGSFFYIAMSIMAMNFLVIVLVVAGMFQMKRINSKDLTDMLDVLVGRKKYAMSVKDIHKYRDMLKKEEERKAMKEQEEGTVATQTANARALEQMRNIQQENAKMQMELLERNRKNLLVLREEIDRLKKEKEEAITRLEDVRKQDLDADLSARQQKLRKVLQNMDAEDIAKYMKTLLATRDDGEYEVARILRNHIKPDQIAATLAELDAGDNRKILPLMENEYADIDAEKLVKRWTNPKSRDFKTPKEIAQLLKKFTVVQTFRIFKLLDPKVRAQVEHALLK